MGGEKKEKKNVKMATVQSESEQPLDNKLINGNVILTGNKPELQPTSATAADCEPEVCAQGGDVKGTAEPGVPSSPAREDSPPHGAALSPSHKDAPGMPCNWKSTLDEQKTGVLSENDNAGDLASAEPGTDCGDTAESLHNENIEQETNKEEEAMDTTIENISKDSKHIREEEELSPKHESANVSEESNIAREDEQPLKQDESTNVSEESNHSEKDEQPLKQDNSTNVSEESMHVGEDEQPLKQDDSTNVSEKSEHAGEDEQSLKQNESPNVSEESKHAGEDEQSLKQDESTNVNKESKHAGEEEEPLKQDESTNVSKESKSHNEAGQSTEKKTEGTGDPESTENAKDITEEKEGEDESKGDGTRPPIKRRKSRMECNECGKKFTRRETYNLHRHFHMHQDEQATLVCKECGVTFEHRSDLIKHRTIHKENNQPSVSHSPQSKGMFKERRKFECEHCGMCFPTMMRLRLHACDQNIEKPFRCPLCRKEFLYRVSINAHMQSHSLDSPHRCQECNKGFQSLETLHVHQRSHAALKPYECPDCNMVFKHRYVMEDHRRRHSEEKAHLCKICGKSFKYSSLLQQHQYLHTGQKPYHCSYCGKTFAFAQNLRAHCRQHKKISARSEEYTTNHNEPRVGQVGKENTSTEQQRNCPLCPQMFSNASDLRTHMLIHEAEYERMSNGKRQDKVYACQYCPLKFQSESLLQSHSQTHMPNFLGINTTHITNQVKAVLERQDDVGLEDDEINSISGVGGLGDQTEKKQFRCRDCGKCFRYRSVLELHMRIHNKGYQCQVCKKSFRFSSYLQQHSIIHTGKKPYKCPDCGKDFAFHHNMKTHQRLHQQKPFRCTQCRKGYSDESQLQRHMLSHTGEKPYKCNMCDKSFALAYLLRDHLNTHTGERPHRCQECHKCFPWLSSLLVHQKIHMRKHQGQSHSYPLSIHSQRGRIGGGRRGRPRLDRDNGRTVLLPEAVIPQQSRSFDANGRERMQLRSQHMQTRNHSEQVHMQQEWHLQMAPSEELLHSQKPMSLLEAQSTSTGQIQWLGSHIKTILPKSDGLPELMHQQQPSQTNVTMPAQPNDFSDRNMSESEPQGKHPSLWMSTPNSTVQKTSLESQHHMDRPSPLDVSQRSVQDPSQWPVLCDSGIAKPSDGGKGMADLASISSETDELAQDLQTANSSGLAKAELGQAGAIVISASASSLPNANPWGVKTSLEISAPVSLQEIPGDALEKQQNRLIQHLPQQIQVPIPPTWVSTTSPNQMGPVNIPFSPARFPLGERPPLWGFQTAPVVSQTLVNGPVPQGHIRAQQHVTLISGHRIPLGQPPTFITPPFPPPPPTLSISAPHPMHPVGRPLPGPLPQGIFFSQGTINELPLMPQVTNLPQLSQQTEPHKIVNKLPFAPDHQMFQCMICGCSLPGELELQMHYMQHAQRDV